MNLRHWQISWKPAGQPECPTFLTATTPEGAAEIARAILAHGGPDVEEVRIRAVPAVGLPASWG
jgi:hypothetical protein